jgi:putative tryptophan/tyrosine transport system substrate-binding protein
MRMAAGGKRTRHTLLWYVQITLGLLWLLPLTQARAQGIVILKSHDLEPFNQAVAGFVAACPVRITEYDLRGTKKEENSIIQRLTAAKPRLIVAIGPLAAQVAREHLRDVPMIFVMVSNPPKHGLQGANLAGVSLDIPVQMQLARYKALVPTLKTLGVIYDPTKTGTMVTEAGGTVATLGLQLLTAPVSTPKEVPAAMRSLLGKIEALWMVPDDTVVTPESFKFLLLTAFENNLPFVTVSDIFVEAGALASLSPDYTDVGRQGCQLATDLESGRLRPAEVMVVPPAKVNLAINLKTASKIGLTLPPEIIQSANKVYR